MGLFSFIKDAGAAVFGAKPQEETGENLSLALNKHLTSLGFNMNDIRFSIAGDKVTLQGVAPTHEFKSKLIVAVGNAKGVSTVEDNMKVTEAGVASTFAEVKHYTVKSGDNLSKISKEMYGDANKYQKIFEANKPMLSHPDKIYVGQVLIIPNIGNA